MCGTHSEVFCKFEELKAQSCEVCGGDVEQRFDTPRNFAFADQFWAGMAPRKCQAEWTDADGKKHIKKVDPPPLSAVRDRERH
jgi:hypothetical protein